MLQSADVEQVSLKSIPFVFYNERSLGVGSNRSKTEVV